MMQPSLVSSRTPSKTLPMSYLYNFGLSCLYKMVSERGVSKNDNYKKTEITIQQFVDLETLYGSSDSLFCHRMQILQPWVNFNAYGS